ncbi:uncharacterized protein LY79DRAFT_290504 [Colletotrichum navitas]|uniref:Uncharacterized protein n=1 Tax=Colletotrichum navitas TaxID=681940 RepID=A0AAD8V3N5_9PEZI|nr:uncharacterized protein LY79DRAFT_290504 [Colletotrichum navitas]KAK1584844.1 hypothetical protein LY79DRAFT_290504 [Colletotrichum navitas]
MPTSSGVRSSLRIINRLADTTWGGLGLRGGENLFSLRLLQIRTKRIEHPVCGGPRTRRLSRRPSGGPNAQHKVKPLTLLIEISGNQKTRAQIFNRSVYYGVRSAYEVRSGVGKTTWFTQGLMSRNSLEHVQHRLVSTQMVCWLGTPETSTPKRRPSRTSFYTEIGHVNYDAKKKKKKKKKNNDNTVAEILQRDSDSWKSWSHPEASPLTKRVCFWPRRIFLAAKSQIINGFFAGVS